MPGAVTSARLMVKWHFISVLRDPPLSPALHLNVDLHNHSTASDGLLDPAQVALIASRNGCDAFALTDHDTLDGLASAQAAAATCGLRFVPGVEISVSWKPAADPDARSTTVHIVGVGIDPDSAVLADNLLRVQSGRLGRAARIADELAQVGVADTLDAALALAVNRNMVARTHFARVLVDRGVVKSMQEAFQRFLTPGKPGYVPHRWAMLTDAVDWIRAAGGIAIMAHPGRYGLKGVDHENLFDEFQAVGGEGVEVVTGSHTAAQYREYARLAERRALLASRGADFHGDGDAPMEPGTLPRLDEVSSKLTPVWDRLGLAAGEP